MCLVAFALDAHPRHRLVLIGNRDESFQRPATPLGRWKDAPALTAGRDLEAGGTWLGVADEARGTRWAVLTNVRDPRRPRPSVRSRGTLPTDFLRGSASARAYARAVSEARDDFDGFNLVVGDARAAFYVSTHTDGVAEIGPGVYGLSNAVLDTPWPKTARARALLREALGAEAVGLDGLLPLLDDTARAPDADLPDTGVGIEAERVLSSVRIPPGPGPGGGLYGTRVSTALVLDRDGSGWIAERTWRADGTQGATVRAALGPRHRAP